MAPTTCRGFSCATAARKRAPGVEVITVSGEDARPAARRIVPGLPWQFYERPGTANPAYKKADCSTLSAVRSCRSTKKKLRRLRLRCDVVVPSPASESSPRARRRDPLHAQQLYPRCREA